MTPLESEPPPECCPVCTNYSKALDRWPLDHALAESAVTAATKKVGEVLDTTAKLEGMVVSLKQDCARSLKLSKSLSSCHKLLTSSREEVVCMVRGCGHAASPSPRALVFFVTDEYGPFLVYPSFYPRSTRMTAGLNPCASSPFPS